MFTGKVLERQPGPWKSDVTGDNPILWTFHVDAIQKGGAAPEQAVSTNGGGSAACAPDLVVGEMYQVFAHRNDDGHLETTICQGTRTLHTGAGEGTPAAAARAGAYIPFGSDGKPLRGVYISTEGTPPPAQGINGTFVASGEGVKGTAAPVPGDPSESAATLPVLAMGFPLFIVGAWAYLRARRDV